MTGFPGRHAGLGAGRQRRQAGRTLVQVPSPARHPDRRFRGAQRAGRTAQRRAARAQHQGDDGRALRRPRGAQPEPLAVAALRPACRSTSCSSPIFVAGFYYKTFMWPAKFWEAIYEPAIRRAAGLGRAARASRSRPLRQGLGALRRAGRRRRPDRPCGSARCRPRRRPRHPVRRRFRARRPPAVATAARSTACPAAEWLARTLAELASLPDVRIMTPHDGVRRL